MHTNCENKLTNHGTRRDGNRYILACVLATTMTMAPVWAFSATPVVQCNDLQLENGREITIGNLVWPANAYYVQVELGSLIQRLTTRVDGYTLPDGLKIANVNRETSLTTVTRLYIEGALKGICYADHNENEIKNRRCTSVGGRRSWIHSQNALMIAVARDPLMGEQRGVITMGMIYNDTDTARIESNVARAMEGWFGNNIQIPIETVAEIRAGQPVITEVGAAPTTLTPTYVRRSHCNAVGDRAVIRATPAVLDYGTIYVSANGSLTSSESRRVTVSIDAPDTPAARRIKWWTTITVNGAHTLSKNVRLKNGAILEMERKGAQLAFGESFQIEYPTTGIDFKIIGANATTGEVTAEIVINITVP